MHQTDGTSCVQFQSDPDTWVGSDSPSISLVFSAFGDIYIK